MSKTPICDRWEYDTNQGGLVVPLNVAKDLETELAEANRKLAERINDDQRYLVAPLCNAEKALDDCQAELAEAQAENVRLAKTMQLAIAINLAMQESSYDMPDLRGHECLAKHKLLSLFDLWRKKVRPRLPGFVDDEISKRDKLIEQMRDALKALKQRHYVNDDDNWYSCPASGLCSNDHAGTDCNCGADHVNSIIQAALRAADGGE